MSYTTPLQYGDPTRHVLVVPKYGIILRGCQVGSKFLVGDSFPEREKCIQAGIKIYEDEMIGAFLDLQEFGIKLQ